MAQQPKATAARQRLYKARQRYLPFLYAIIGAALALNLVGVLRLTIEPVELVLDAKISYPGYTMIRIPPIGNISARTHRYQPLQLVLTLDNIDLEQLRTIASISDLNSQQDLAQYFGAEVNRVIGAVIIKLVLIGGSGGLLGMYLGGQRHRMLLASGFLLGCGFILAVIAATYFGYDLQAFANPQYHGIIEAAPWMIGLIQEGLVKVDQLGDQIQSLAANLYTVFNQIENLKNVGVLTSDLNILHVSDIHNHPVAYDFIGQVVATFPIDVIIDTGDLTDWGTPLEAEIVSQIEQLGVTYLFAAGNHEAPDVLARLEQTGNVLLLGPDPVEVMGITVAGVPDPSAESYSPENVSIAELSRYASQINELYGSKQHGIDIFAVHNHRIATQIEPGIFPVVLYGHNHVQSISQIGDTVYVNAGTTGAAGIRGIQGSHVVPFSLSVLYFTRDPGSDRFVLAAVDSIQVQSLQQSFSLERTFITSPRRNQGENVENSRQISG